MSPIRALTRALVMAGAVLGSASANAIVTQIDEFKVVRSGTAYFTDTFDDNLAPPLAPLQALPAGTFNCGAAPECYIALGTFFAGDESGGKLRLNSANGTDTESALGNPRILLSARLRTNISTDPADANAGLRMSRTFNASALFDLVLPGPGEQMVVRFTDGHIDTTEPGHRTDFLTLNVRRSDVAGAQPEIRFFEQNFFAGTLDQIDVAPLNTGLGADQIRLTLSHPVENSTEVFASWEYLQLGAVVGTGSFATPANIFDGETFTRADFGVSAPIPEPQTYAMMLVGVALVGWQLRRRARRPPPLA